MMKTRQEAAQKDVWNTEALYPNFQAWENHFKSICKEKNHNQEQWPEISKWKGKLSNEKNLSEFFKYLFNLSKELEQLYTYAHLRHDEDIADTQHKGAYSRITTMLHQFSQKTAWIHPELLSLSEETIKKIIKSPDLKPYAFHIEKIVRLKPYTLSEREEELIALSGQPFQSFYKAFNSLSDADFSFGKIKDKEEKEYELTHASYALLLRSQDRSLRENAFKQYHQKYRDHQNTLTEIINGQIQKSLYLTKARRFPSSLDSALFANNIPTSVYRNLITAVNKRLPSLHAYLELRKKKLKLEKLCPWDLYVPLTNDLDIKMDYTHAVKAVVESVAPLGAEYQHALKNGLTQERWVDWFENKNKRSGAYSSGCYTSAPYILMNYKNILRDVYTLAHEAGHSMHSYLSRKHQPYQYGDYPIFVAEVASTFNEDLLLRHLLTSFTEKKEQEFLINQRIEDIRSTLFRQTMFAEFELLIHDLTAKNIPLTPDRLNKEYLELNQKYFGESVEIGEELSIEWARIPHFYYNFYVFQYATGISAATALAEKVVNGGEKERDDYLSFLKSGCSGYPIELLKKAGVDMETAEPIELAIDSFDSWVSKLSSF